MTAADFGRKAVEMIEIVKEFGDFTANDKISLTLHQGEVHALLGENGAGKTTLINTLYGLYRPTSGTIRLNGRQVTVSNPTGAIRHGIGMVHQHFMLVNTFTVAENIILCNESEPTIEYTKQVTDPQQFDPQFVTALAYRIAQYIAMPITGDRSIMSDMKTLADIEIGKAQATDANEGFEAVRPAEATWITARY